VPTPYATEWWAAGPLLEELHDTTYKFNTKYFKGEEKEVVAPFGLTRVVASAPWVCGPTVEGRVKSFAKAETAPLAIARAWLLTYEHGLLEDYQ
jgi:hypothetical protein